MKKISIVLLLALFALAACTAPADDATRAQIEDVESPATSDGSDDALEVDVIVGAESVLVDETNGELGFEGFGPGKSHLGTFEEWNAELLFAGEEIVGGSGTVELTSMTIENGTEGKLYDHVLSEDFLDAENNPQATFDIVEVVDGEVTTDLTFRGETKRVSFPINSTNGVVSADFVIDFAAFGMDHPAANSEVRVFFTIEP